MKKIFFSALALILLFVSLFTSKVNAQTAADEQAVRNTIDKAIEAYYAADVEKMSAFYAENATMIVYTGQKINGKKAIHESTVEMLKTEKPSAESFKFKTNSVRFLNANTALVVADLSGTAQMGDQTINWEGVCAIVMSRHGDKWRIELEANTPIMPAPEPGK